MFFAGKEILQRSGEDRPGRLVRQRDSVPAGYQTVDYEVRIKGNGTPEQFAAIHETVIATSPNYFNMSRPIQMNGRLIVG